MRGGGARLRGNGSDAFAIELQRQRRGEVVGDENRIAAPGDVNRVMIGEVEEDRQDPDMHIGEVTHPLPQHRRGVPRKVLAPFQQDQIEGLFRGDVLTDQGHDAVGQLTIIEDGKLHIEDGRLFIAHGGFRACAQMPQPVTGAVKCRTQARDFRLDRLVRDQPIFDLRHLPAQQVHRANHNPRRRRDATEHRLHWATTPRSGPRPVPRSPRPPPRHRPLRP